MIYKAPFMEITSALYSVLVEKGNSEINWFDSAVPITEIDAYFKRQAEFAYGIFGASEADCVSNKTTVIWDCSLQLEIYSNYKGRKVVAEQLNALMTFLSSKAGTVALQTALNKEGFALISMQFRPLRVNLPIYSDNGVWQSGSVNVTFRVGQLNQE